jgi:hypothetical protein
VTFDISLGLGFRLPRWQTGFTCIASGERMSALCISPFNMEIPMKYAASLLIVAGLSLSSSAMAETPRMKLALKNLQEAKTALAEASADKGGHRVAAMKLIDQAMKEVQAGIEFDKTHGGDKK